MICLGCVGYVRDHVRYGGQDGLKLGRYVDDKGRFGDHAYTGNDALRVLAFAAESGVSVQTDSGKAWMPAPVVTINGHAYCAEHAFYGLEVADRDRQAVLKATAIFAAAMRL